MILILVVLLSWNLWLTLRIQVLNDELKNTSDNPTVTTVTKMQSKFTEIIDSSKDKVVDVILTFSSSTPSIYTGFIYKYDEEGNVYILMNENAVSNAQVIEVSFANGISVPAELCGINHYYDLAVLRCTPSFEVPLFSYGKVDLMKEGEWLVAIGSTQQTLQNGPILVGILSNKYAVYSSSVILESKETTEINVPVLQVSGILSRRIGGGPLMNEAGEVVGMITNRLSSSMSDASVVALPIDEVIFVSEKIIAQEEIRYDELGYSFTQIQDLTSYQKNIYSLRLDQFTGLYINKIDRKNKYSTLFPITEGDILIKINNQEVNTIRDVRLAMMNIDSFDELILTIVRPSAEYTELEFKAEIVHD